MGHKQLGRHVAKCLGETIVINSSLMQYIACLPDYSMSGTMDDEGEGMGLYLYDNGTRAYLCPGDDGNSFTLSAERFGRYGDDQHFDGVFYRNADFYAYTDMENAEFMKTNTPPSISGTTTA